MTQVTQLQIDTALALLARPSGAHYCDLIDALCDEQFDCGRVGETISAIEARGYQVQGDRHRYWIEFNGRAA